MIINSVSQELLLPSDKITHRTAMPNLNPHKNDVSAQTSKTDRNAHSDNASHSTRAPLLQGDADVEDSTSPAVPVICSQGDTHSRVFGGAQLMDVAHEDLLRQSLNNSRSRPDHPDGRQQGRMRSIPREFERDIRAKWPVVKGGE